MSLTRSVVGPAVSGVVSSVFGAGGGGGAAVGSALEIVQAAYDVSGLTAFWDIQGSIGDSMWTQVDPVLGTSATNISTTGTVGAIADSSILAGATVADFIAAESLSGVMSTTWPAGSFDGHISGGGGTSRPALTAGTPKYLAFRSGDHLRTSSAPTLTAHTFVFGVRTSATRGILLGDGVGAFLFQFRDGNASTLVDRDYGSPTYRIDGASFSGTTQDDAHTEIADGAWHVVTAQGVSYSLSNDLYPARYSTTGSGVIDGDIDLAYFVCLPDPGAAELAAIEADCASVLGITI